MTPIDITLVKMSLDDIEMLIEISKATFMESFGHYNSKQTINRYTLENFNSQQLSKELSNPNSEFYILKQNEKVLGYLKINSGNAQTETTDVAAIEIERIYLLAEYQGQKLGSMLLDMAIKLYHSGEHSFLWLGVWEQNRKAIKFYEKQNFVKYGEHKFNFGGDIQTDWLMKYES